MNKKNETIKCLMHYDVPDLSHQNRHYHLAAATKAEYIFDTFARLGFQVDILSASLSKEGAVSPKTIRLAENITLRLLRSGGRGNTLKNKLSTAVFKARYFLKCLRFIKSGDTVWVYHSLAFINVLNFLKKIKRFRLILEVEEIYGDVILSERKKEKERKLFRHADAFIFPSYLLEEQFNLLKKPFAVSHGAYRLSKVKGDLFNDGRIHVLYAGTLDKRMGSRLAIRAAEYLSDDYCMHILGGGSPDEIREVEEMSRSASKGAGCEVIYGGILRGEEYLRYVSSCNIGLCPHDPKEKFNETSFPSKILSYMTNGLSVVSIRIPNITHSDVDEFMIYYDENTPCALAEAIRRAAKAPAADAEKKIRSLDQTFTDAINRIVAIKPER